MKIQGTESRFVTSVEQPKVNRTFEELKANTPKQDDAVKVTISKEGRNSYKHMISIPESSREEMFELAKKEFINGNGMVNGDTTKRGDIYTSMQRKMNKNDRLSATWTLEQYESKYRKAFVAAAKAADPKWDFGKPIPTGALDGIKREDIEASMKAIDIKL